MENLNQKLVEDLPDAIVVINQAGKIVLVNQQTEKLFGYARQELLGQTLETLLPERFREMHIKHREFYFLNPKKRSLGTGLDLFALTKPGIEIPVDISLAPIQTDQGLLACAAIRDVTEQKNMNKKLHTLAYYDVTTALPNRFYFYKTLQQVLKKSKNEHTEVAVFYLDIDDFKKINDTYGHIYGDALLKQIGTRLKKTIRHQDFLARQSGDEFTVLVQDTHHDIRIINKITRRLMSAFKKPFLVNGIGVECSTGIGFSTSSLSGQSADQMLQDAEIALYHAKSRGPKFHSHFF